MDAGGASHPTATSNTPARRVGSQCKRHARRRHCCAAGTIPQATHAPLASLPAACCVPQRSAAHPGPPHPWHPVPDNATCPKPPHPSRPASSGSWVAQSPAAPAAGKGWKSGGAVGYVDLDGGSVQVAAAGVVERVARVAVVLKRHKPKALGPPCLLVVDELLSGGKKEKRMEGGREAAAGEQRCGAAAMEEHGGRRAGEDACGCWQHVPALAHALTLTVTTVPYASNHFRTVLSSVSAANCGQGQRRSSRGAHHARHSGG